MGVKKVKGREKQFCQKKHSAEKFWVRKKFWSEKFFWVWKKNLVKKNIGSGKKFRSFFVSEKNVGPKKIDLAIIDSAILDSTILSFSHLRFDHHGMGLDGLQAWLQSNGLRMTFKP